MILESLFVLSYFWTPESGDSVKDYIEHFQTKIDKL